MRWFEVTLGPEAWGTVRRVQPAYHSTQSTFVATTVRSRVHQSSKTANPCLHARAGRLYRLVAVHKQTGGGGRCLDAGQSNYSKGCYHRQYLPFTLAFKPQLEPQRLLIRCRQASIKLVLSVWERATGDTQCSKSRATSSSF